MELDSINVVSIPLPEADVFLHDTAFDRKVQILNETLKYFVHMNTQNKITVWLGTTTINIYVVVNQKCLKLAKRLI